MWKVLPLILFITLISTSLYFFWYIRRVKTYGEFWDRLKNRGVEINILMEYPPPDEYKDFVDLFLLSSDYAVYSCDFKAYKNFSVDGYNSFCGDYSGIVRQGGAHIISKTKAIGDTVDIFGSIHPLEKCKLPEIKKIENKAEKSLRLTETEEIEIKPGIHHYKNVALADNASLKLSGPTVMLVKDVILSGSSRLNSGCFPWNLRLIAEGDVTIKNRAKLCGVVISYGKVVLEDEAEIYGSVFAEKFEGTDKASLHYDSILSISDIEFPKIPPYVGLSVGEGLVIHTEALNKRRTVIPCTPLRWGTNEPSIASVNEAGIITGENEGTTEIYAHILWRAKYLDAFVTQHQPYGDIWLTVYPLSQDTGEAIIDKLSVEVCDYKKGWFDMSSFLCKVTLLSFEDEFLDELNSAWSITRRISEETSQRWEDVWEMAHDGMSFSKAISAYILKGMTKIAILNPSDLAMDWSDMLMLTYVPTGSPFKVPRFIPAVVKWNISVKGRIAVSINSISGAKTVVLVPHTGVREATALESGDENIVPIGVSPEFHEIKFAIAPHSEMEFVLIDGKLVLNISIGD